MKFISYGKDIPCSKCNQILLTATGILKPCKCNKKQMEKFINMFFKARKKESIELQNSINKLFKQ